MAALPDLITVAQYRQLPDNGEFVYELHHGEVVAMSRPKARHWKLQLRLMRLLEPKLRLFGEVGMEFPYRPLAEFELRAADVAAVSRGRWETMDPDDNLRGAPELVIEVKSPSNTAAQLRELATLCLANGTLECWIVDPKKNSITVIQRDGSTVVYEEGQSIPLAAFGAGSLAISEIFATQSEPPPQGSN
ncbi:MAG TPA: Uma2 family endonuclease [Candidatus Solibacter sp.]|nr:Uma2 family endonuclease [Candidatus Solibacter sp.]